ncbi:MAG: hypothetical protein ABIL05_03310 [candidate division WOR-3 bacterium]
MIKRFLLLIIILTINNLSCPSKVEYLPAPQNIGIAAEYDGLSIRITWEPDTINQPDGYIIYFNNQPIDTVKSFINSGYIHNKPATTGRYYLIEYKGSILSGPSDEVSSIPLPGIDLPVREINSRNPNGFGLSRDSGQSTSHPMYDSSNISGVDFYLTNYRSDSTSQPYYIASPNLIPTDSTIKWQLLGTMHTNGFFGPLSGSLTEIDTLPNSGYYSKCSITPGRVYALYTQDGFFALISIVDLDSIGGKILVRPLFQPVRNLRLFKTPD